MNRFIKPALIQKQEIKSSDLSKASSKAKILCKHF